MPIVGPSERGPLRFDPVHLSDDDLGDLATFTGMSRERCLDRVRSYSSRELADEWRRHDPQTPDAILNFYKSTDLYVWELMQWHASTARYPYWSALTQFADRYPPEEGWGRVYDFGCGIGTDGLFLASRGYEVTLTDVDCPAFRFAQHRFSRRKLKARFEESYSLIPAPSNTYDAVVCFDVLEHLPDPVGAVKRLLSSLRPRGVLLQQGSFVDTGEHPCHLESGISDFGGLKWHIQLSALGLRGVTGMVYQKTDAITTLVQRARFRLWKATGLWLVRVRP